MSTHLAECATRELEEIDVGPQQLDGRRNTTKVATA
jgi:hypothetical protein